MPQEKKSTEQIKTILANIQFMNWEIRLLEKGDGYLLQIIFMDVDVENPDLGPVPQHCRKWYVSPYSTESEIVETAWKAVKTAMEHEVREKFMYRGRRIFSPHFDVNKLVDLCDKQAYDIRK